MNTKTNPTVKSLAPSSNPLLSGPPILRYAIVRVVDHLNAERQIAIFEEHYDAHQFLATLPQGKTVHFIVRDLHSDYAFTQPLLEDLAATFLRMVRADGLNVQTDDLNEYMLAAWHGLTGRELFAYSSTIPDDIQDTQRALDLAHCDAAWTLAKANDKLGYDR